MLINASNPQYIQAIRYLINRYLNICRYIEENNKDILMKESIHNLINYYENIQNILFFQKYTIPDSIDSTEQKQKYFYHKNIFEQIKHEIISSKLILLNHLEYQLKVNFYQFRYSMLYQHLEHLI